jgi:hypothetical protein
MPRPRAALLSVSTVALAVAACSSWDTGTPEGRVGERACLDTCEALARAAERCGDEYLRAYDRALADVADGDCKNVTSVRDEPQLRKVCLPALAVEPCSKVQANEHDPACSKQLQRPL